MEVTYEELRLNPVATLERIYQTLHLPDFTVARPAVEQRLAREGAYQPRQYIFNPAKIKEIDSLMF